MLKKYIYMILTSITLFSFVQNKIYAYEFKNPENESAVKDMINEIYDSKQQYDDLVGEYVEREPSIYNASSDAYWWPIGSGETQEVDGKIYAKGEPLNSVITSPYGFRDDPFGRGQKFHSGVDISGAFANGEANLVAVKAGIVVGMYDGCTSGAGLSNCGGGYGNYVIIQHFDNNYSLYAHLHENSITVKMNENVEQGQVIGKMGSSGNSTGTHLHFEIREGQNSSDATVDPLTYISLENPRPVTSTDEFMKWLNAWEGSTGTKGDSYIVVNIGDGVRTVGSGVTLEYNASKFKQYGINIADYPVGSTIPIDIVDKIKYEIVNEKRSYVEAVLSEKSIVLQENQIQALMSHTYNAGNIDGFTSAYTKYGNSIDLYDNWFYRNVMKGSQFEAGLTKRRKAEFTLFYSGEYIYNS